jgi:hypothetical protein
MVAAPEVWRRHRFVDRYLASAAVPVLAAAGSEGGRPLLGSEVETALHLLRPRYPVVVADLLADRGGGGGRDLPGCRKLAGTDRGPR